jgi:hypothetical protein
MKPRNRARSLFIIAALGVVFWGLLLWLRGRPPEPIARVEIGLGAREESARVPASPRPSRVLTTEAPPPAAPPPPVPKFHFHPRDPNEWQGMLVRDDAGPYCSVSATCSLGKACMKGSCLACERDGDCVSGEACVLDHCVLADRVGCRSRKDCGGKSFCVLSGTSSTLRGNEEMRSYCLNPESGAGSVPPEPEVAEQNPPPPHTEDDELLRRANEIAQTK